MVGNVDIVDIVDIVKICHAQKRESVQKRKKKHGLKKIIFIPCNLLAMRGLYVNKGEAVFLSVKGIATSAFLLCKMGA